MARLLDKKRPDGTWPFQWKSSAATDVAETIRKAREKLAQEVKSGKPIPIRKGHDSR